MYEAYFQLREKPFDIVPNPAYLYLSDTHKHALMYLNYGLKDRLGFVVMTGEVGSGKTTLLRELVRTLSQEFTFARLFNTRVGSEELIAMINEDFGLDTAGKGKVILLKELNAFLINEYEQGRCPVLIIDEAQNLTPDLLEEVRMLSNLETDTVKLLQILLAGQPELGQILALPEMRQLRQRISILPHIRPLTRFETEEYILHRLTIAGNREAISFRDGAFDEIHAVTGGIPRKINTLCNFILLTAFTEQRKDADVVLINDVATGLGFAEDTRGRGDDTQRATGQGSEHSSSQDERSRLLSLKIKPHDGEGTTQAIPNAS